MTDGAPRDLLHAVVGLVRQLRARGVRTTPGSSVEAARALGVVDVLDREEVRDALRAVLTARPEDRAPFDEAFDAAWAPTGGLPSPMPDLGHLRPAPAPAPPTPRPRLVPVTLQNWMKPGESDDAGEEVPMQAPSDEELLGSRDFSAWTTVDEVAFQRLARRIARRLALRRSRRWRPARRGRQVDMRGTLRQAVRTAGELLKVQRRARRLRKTRLVALCDVSGSMELYARFLLQFLHALQNSFASVETFVFATRLSRITDQLRGADYRVALRHLGREVRDWSGGTRIGAAMAAVVRDHHRLIGRRTIVLVLSDGWDVGEPEALARAMAEVHRRAGKVIWLNPLMGAAGYVPATRGMQAALRHVDLLAPAHNLEALERLVPRLVV